MTRTTAHLRAAAGPILLVGMVVHAATAVAQPAPTSAVVRIAVQWSDQTTAHGVAFRECGSGLWVAPAHVVSGPGGGDADRSLAPDGFELQRICDGADLAVLATLDSTSDAAPCLELWPDPEPPHALSMISVSEPAALASAPQWTSWSDASLGYATLADGEGSGLAQGEPTVFWLHSLPAVDGDSGAPIVAPDGRVFAVQLGVHEPTGRSLAIGVAAVAACLNSAGVVAP